MTHSLELDYSYEYSFGELDDDLKPYNLKAQIVELCGPAGGNPLIEINGDRNDIERYLVDVYCCNRDDAEHYMQYVNTK